MGKDEDLEVALKALNSYAEQRLSMQAGTDPAGLLAAAEAVTLLANQAAATTLSEVLKRVTSEQSRDFEPSGFLQMVQAIKLLKDGHWPMPRKVLIDDDL
jgi:hypothetical protein